MRLLFCGDIMPGGVLSYQDQYIDNDMRQYLASFDCRIGTLECAIGTSIAPAPEKLRENGGSDNVCFARDEDFYRVKELGFNVMSLGNNHSFDLGEEGLRNTIQKLIDNNISYFGAGMNLAEASAPAIIQMEGMEICLLGCCIKGLSPVKLIVATENSYGVYQPTIEELVEQIKSLRCQYDKVIVMPHWGEEHILFPPYKCVDYALRMINAGADAVFGSHSHRISTRMAYKGKPVYFGLGNFLYPDNCLKPPRPFFYPHSSEELNNMRRCINYPRSVSANTIVVWSEDSRVGLVAETTIDKQHIKACCRFVRMGNDNILKLYKKDSILKSFFMQFFLYPLINIIALPPIYKPFKSLIWRMARLRLRCLGDFRKNI